MVTISSRSVGCNPNTLSNNDTLLP
jgi:hypothetical protein